MTPYATRASCDARRQTWRGELRMVSPDLCHQEEGDRDADGHCVVNGQIEEFLYAPDPGGDLRSVNAQARRTSAADSR